ncbi:hypothetical protein [Cyanophage S-TIM5]|uniref:Uncharacterized protein n=1 Tax=Cyanophage S-TIM5 TaxID=1137745 RepID=A0ACD4B102_9CAUD|nr:hypothetical protein F417_gp104 [Cyanophage S-TIM5]UTS51907.1 hypothetical protein [Cyanophage S-TIM5]UYE96876.1 hypothetical protein [Cyanophage S-TIM66]UYE97088.1 hypothetical protein [Cyanophage S-TIM61]
MAQEASFIRKQIQAQQAFEILSKKTGGLESDAFIHPGIIADINDPEKRGRVKVVYGEDEANTKTEWVPVLNAGKGVLTSQLLGSNVIVGSISGNVNDNIVLGVYNNEMVSSLPTAIPTIDKSAIQYVGDPGTQCNRENEGRMYVFSNNVSQDLKICLRRNNRQEGPDKDVYEWKNITRGLVVQGSGDPKEIEQGNVLVEQDPLGKCTQEREGEQVQFAEDRDYRQMLLTCKKDENKEWGWVPVSTVPTYFKSTLPKCTEKVHGQTALHDDGNNSEMIICVRYNKEMKWVKYGSREVVQWEGSTVPTPEEVAKTIDNPLLQFGGAAAAAAALGGGPLGTLSSIVSNSDNVNSLLGSALNALGTGSLGGVADVATSVAGTYANIAAGGVPVAGAITSILGTATSISQIPSNIPNQYLTPNGVKALADQAALSSDNVDLSFAEELSTEEFKDKYGVDGDDPALELL